MQQYERQQAVMEYLKQHHTATIHTLAKQLCTSEASIRRDIVALDAAGLVVTLPQQFDGFVSTSKAESI